MTGFVEVQVTDWEEYVKLAVPLDGYYFRGHGDASWQLKTSLEREYFRYDPRRIDSFTNKEYWILHEFRRKYHLYASQAPAEGDHFEWLALLQHYGCPTRLLDFTVSPYVAAYFALEATLVDACVWAINWTALRDSLKAKEYVAYDLTKGVLKDTVNLHHIDLINRQIANQDYGSMRPHVVPLEPKKMSERLARQQGLFLAPVTLGEIGDYVSFGDNLTESFGDAGGSITALRKCSASELFKDFGGRFWRKHINVAKIILPRSIHESGLRHLKNMGITNESLFPGLDGLARSLSLTVLRGVY